MHLFRCDRFLVLTLRPVLVIAVAAIPGAHLVCAATTPSTPAPVLAATAISAGDPALVAQRTSFEQSLQQIETGPLTQAAGAVQAFAGHPLYPYLQYALLRRTLDSAGASAVRDFLTTFADLPVAARLRGAWLVQRIKQHDWPTVRAFYAGETDPELRCGWLVARLAEETNEALLDDIQPMWLSGKTAPTICDPAFAALEKAGRITPALRWQRIMLAAEAGQMGLMRWLARGLNEKDAKRAKAYADFLAAPALAATAAFPDDRTAARILTLGLTRLARRDPDDAENLLAALGKRLPSGSAEYGEAIAAIALWSASSYRPESARRFAAVPASAFDASLYEWRVREALARGDEASTLDAISAMPDEQRANSHWRYLEARLRERKGDTQQASTLLSGVARESNFEGFLAADRLDLPYTLCPREAGGDAAVRARIAAIPGLVRALELFAIDRIGWAAVEWDAAVAALSPEQRRVAVVLAVDAGWFDRAAFTLKSGEDLAYYKLRFPVLHAPHLEKESKTHGVDPAWVAALIRAESAWIPTARSHANARGLMQLLPATGRAVAKKLGLSWPGADGLYDPSTNITLGTAYLSKMLERFDAQPVLATAAYNAGPTPTERWRDQRPPRDPDLWIETIPYRETRDYVARVFAFSVIYDWRLNGTAVPLSARLAGTAAAATERRSFRCLADSLTQAQP